MKGRNKPYKWFKLMLDRPVKTGRVWWTRTLYVKAQSKSMAKRLADERIKQVQHMSFGIDDATVYKGKLHWYHAQITD